MSYSGKCASTWIRKSARFKSNKKEGKNMLDVITRIAEAVIEELKKD
ncbi:TPA: hypothetical protein ACU4HR_000963 [Haemophilus influenzae]